MIVALAAWGLKHDGPETLPIVLVDGETGELVDPVMVDRRTGREAADPVVEFRARPDAPELKRERLTPAP